MEACTWASFCDQVVNAALLRNKKVVGDAVGEDAVDLFRHAHVATAQATFQVGQGQAHFVGHQRPGEGAVHIARHHHQVRLPGSDFRFQADHDVAHLRGRAGLRGVQEAVWPQAELVEEHRAHPVVVVLAGVYQLHVHSTPCSHRLEARHFDEIRARAHHHHQLLHASLDCGTAVRMPRRARK